MGELTDKIKGNTNEAIGKAKQKGDAESRAEGRQQEAKGKTQQLGGEIKGKLGDDI